MWRLHCKIILHRSLHAALLFSFISSSVRYAYSFVYSMFMLIDGMKISFICLLVLWWMHIFSLSPSLFPQTLYLLFNADYGHTTTMHNKQFLLSLWKFILKWGKNFKSRNQAERKTNTSMEVENVRWKTLLALWN